MTHTSHPNTVMDLIKDHQNLEEFLTYVGSLLYKMDVFVTDTLDNHQLTGYAALKQLELTESLKFVKSYFKSEDFSPPRNNHNQQETDSRPHTPLSIKSDTGTNSDKNNNGDTTLTLPATESSQTTAHDDSQTLQCYCSSDDVIVLSKQVDILQARLSHFSSDLQERIRECENQKFPSYLSDFQFKEYCGWLNVDEMHRFYGVISDCCFCLFADEELASPSIMTLILNNTHSQPIKSDFDNNSFTITLEGDELLYFYADMAEERSEWIRWLNVGAQLPYQDLQKLMTPRAEQMDEYSQTESLPHIDTPESSVSPSEMSFEHTEINGDVELSDMVTGDKTMTIEGTEVIMRRKGANDVSKPPPRQTNQSMRLSHNPRESSYDWGLDQGTTRRFPSSQELNKQLKLRKAQSLSEGLPYIPTCKVTSPRHEKPGYVITNGQTNGRESSSSSNSHASNDSATSNKRSSSIMKRASSIFSGRSASVQLSTTVSVDSPDSAVTGTEPVSPPPSSAGEQRKKGRSTSSIIQTTSTARHKGLSQVDMSAMCEMQGYLLCKKILKWASCYCCVYNGIISCFKDSESSLPDIQVSLKKCRIVPVDEKKAKRPFAFKLITPSKSMYFAATSDVDLDSWYSVFNEHCKGALEVSQSPVDIDNITPVRTPEISRSTASYKSGGENSEYSIDNQPSFEVESVLPTRSVSLSETTLSEHIDQSAEGTDSAADLRLSPVEGGRVMRSVSDSDYRRHRLLHNGYLSRLQGLTRSVNDIPTCLASSTSSSSADELSSDELQVSPLDGVKGQREGKQKKRLTQDDQRKHLLNKMRREKERIEKALELKEKRDQENFEAEMLSNMTKLQQRRTSAQLKYDFMEKQLHDKKEDKPKYSGPGSLFHKPGRNEKLSSKSSSLEIPAEDESNKLQHLYKEMEELKSTLDEIDKGLVETKSHHASSLSKVLNNRPAALSSSNTQQTRPAISSHHKSTSSLSEHKLRGLESIIEALDNKQRVQSTDNVLNTAENNNLPSSEEIDNLKADDSKVQLEISQETLALISEFETMTNQLLSRRSSVNYDEVL